jgi:hypothetical protein
MAPPLLMTRCQKLVCASQDKILRSLAEDLRELPQVAQHDTTCESLQSESRAPRDGGAQDDSRLWFHFTLPDQAKSERYRSAPLDQTAVSVVE